MATVTVKVIEDTNMKAIVVDAGKTVAAGLRENGIEIEGKQITLNGSTVDTSKKFSTLLNGAEYCTVSVLKPKANA